MMQSSILSAVSLVALASCTVDEAQQPPDTDSA